MMNITNQISSILEKLIVGFNYVNDFFNEVGNILANIFGITSKNIDQFQSDNPEGFIVLASVCLIFCMYALFFLVTYKITEDEKYKKNQLLEKYSSDIE